MPALSKQCSSCFEQLEASPEFFHRQKNGLYGFTSKCKSCKNSQIAEWTKRNPEKSRAQKDRWKALNYDKYLAVKRDDQRRRRHRKSLESVDVKLWLEMQELGCLACGSHDDITQDHVIPLSLGGRNHISNIQPLCRTCNSKKGVSVADYRPSLAVK